MQKLSVVVVVYDMPHQIVRTVRSLSPAMQRGVAADDYELLVVDNGSPRPIDRKACESFGAAIRWLEVENPTSSPARAANLGLAESRGPLVGVFIDGARMASPGMLVHALLAARVHERPVISTLSYHLGRRPQYEAAASGYDEAAEAALLATVDWAADGYRLFDISVPGHQRFQWFSRPFETNGLFMPENLWEEVGGFDEQFVSPGGGLVNPDVFERTAALPDVRFVSLLGEATFHQVHGGVSTNRVLAEAPLEDWHAEYELLRGRRFAGPRAPISCVGTPTPEAAAAILRSGSSAAGALGRRYVDLLKRSLAEDPLGRIHLDVVDACVAATLDDGVAGDLVDYGEDGRGAALMLGILLARGVDNRRVWVAHRGSGRDLAARFERLALSDDDLWILDGPPERWLAEAPIAAIAMLRLDGGADVITAALTTLYERVVPGGYVLVDESPAGTGAVESFRAERGISEPLVCNHGAGFQWRKAGVRVATAS